MICLVKSSPARHAALLRWIFFCTSATAALISSRVITFALLPFDSLEASELTSLRTTCRGKLSRLTKKSGLLIPAGRT